MMITGFKKPLALLMAGLTLSASAGDVTGKVTLKGKAPAEKAVRINNPEMAKRYPKLTTRKYQTSAVGALASVLVYVTNDFKGQTFTAPTTPVVLDHAAGVFQPYVLAAQTGQPFEMKCSDHHRCTFVAFSKLNPPFALPPLDTSITRSFAKAEMAIPFKCDMHPWNRAYVSVFAHPYFAVTDANGSFTIKQLPAGTYTLEIRHPAAGTVTKSITVGEQALTADFEMPAK